MLEPEDLAPVDDVILDLLHEGRITTPYASEETGYSQQYVRDRLNRLLEHDVIRKVHRGLYELKTDPREGQ